MDPRGIYRRQQFEALETGPLVIRVTETAERAARQGKRGLLLKLLHELLTGVDPDRGQVAGNLIVLYEYLIHEAREGRLDRVEPVLAELSATWREAWRREIETRSRAEAPSAALVREA